jgi:hypothetical protein
MNSSLNLKSSLLWLGMLGFVGMSVFCVLQARNLITSSNSNQPIVLTCVMMVAFTLIVVLAILMLIFFKATNTEDKTQALGLPSGSVRALIAFALVLMFICMGVYLHQAMSFTGPPVDKQNLTEDEVNALRAQFSLVIVHPATPVTGQEGKPRFDVTYYQGRSPAADDLAKQMFTQLATVFVTVIGFYFGSSTAASGVGAGVAAAGTLSTKTPPANASVPAALTEAKAITHDAGGDIGRIQAALAQTGDNSAKKSNIQSILDKAQTAMTSIQGKMQTAAEAAAKFGTAGTDAENNAAAADVVKARDEIKALAATIKSAADQAASLP